MVNLKSNRREVAETCYAMAYYLLPEYVFDEPESVIQELALGQVGAMSFYLRTCQQSGNEPDLDAAEEFSVHTGSLDETRDYYAIQYPSPPPVDPAIMEVSPASSGLHGIVLAPHFSVMLVDRGNQQALYFVLGQSPDGLTTLRRVTPERNARLGRGCEPDLGKLLDLLRARLAGGVDQR